jgi:hypothetical protein
MTATDFTTIMRMAMGNPTATEISNALLLRAFNLAAESVVTPRPRKFPELRTTEDITTASGKAEYELTATDIVEICHLYDVTNTRRLKPMDEDDYVRKLQANVSNQKPRKYLEGEVGSNNRIEITLWPTCDAIYTVRVYYWRLPPEIVLSPTATSPVTARKWDLPILEAAIKMALPWVGNRPEVARQAPIAGEAEGRVAGTGPPAAEIKHALESAYARSVRNVEG